MLTDKDVVGGNVTDARYDRQIRLWGKQGQRALQEANIVAVGATVAVCEALKSIILTGVHSVTLVDERIVTSNDVAHNFFLSVSDIGAPLASCAVRHLCELNTQCAGLAVCDRTPQAWADGFTGQALRGPSETDDVKSFGEAATEERIMKFMDMATPVANTSVLTEASSQGLSRMPSLLLVSNRYPDWSSASPLVRVAAHALNIPVLLLESRGLTAYLQTYARDRVVVNPHPPPDQIMEDLRIFEPFPELKAWFDAYDPDDGALFHYEDPDSLNAHSHLPYICLLYHAYQRHTARRQREAAQDPTASLPGDISWPLKKADFQALKQELMKMRKREHPPQEGFQEALTNCYSRLNRPLVMQPSVEALLSDARTEHPDALFAKPYGWPVFNRDPNAAAGMSSSETGQAKRTKKEPVEAPPAGMTTNSQGEDRVALTLDPIPDREYLLTWFLLRAVKEFRDHSAAPHRVLPLSGHVPDFTTLTAWFQELRAIYQAKHTADVSAIQQSTTALLKTAATTACASEGDTASAQRVGSFVQSVSAEDIARLAKDLVTNIWHACALSFSPAFMLDEADVLGAVSDTTDLEGGNEEAEAHKHSSEDLLHRAWQRVLQRQLRRFLTTFANFCESTGLGVDSKRACGVGIALCALHEQKRLTALSNDTRQAREPRAVGTHHGMDHGTLFPFLRSLATGDSDDVAWPLNEDDTFLLTKICWEVERVGEAELPSVGAIMGSLAAQEVIKLVQRRRVPTTFPVVYSGLDGVYYNLPTTV